MLALLGWAWDQETGDPTRKLLLMNLADAADQEGVCFPSQKRLAKRCEVSTRSVRTHLAKLEEDGFLVRVERRRANGSRTTDAYQIQAPPDIIDHHHSRPKPLGPVKPGTHARLRASLVREVGATCWYCGREGSDELGPDGETWHLDRIVPGVRGGTYARSNLALACASCDKAKGARTPGEWRGCSDLDAFAISIPARVIEALARAAASGSRLPPAPPAKRKPAATSPGSRLPGNEPLQEPTAAPSSEGTDVPSSGVAARAREDDPEIGLDPMRRLDPLTRASIRGLYGGPGLEGTDERAWGDLRDAGDRERVLRIAALRWVGERHREFNQRLFRSILRTVIEEQQEASPRADPVSRFLSDDWGKGP